MKIRLADNLKSLDATTVTQKMAFLGISGSGKTYAAGKLAEELLAGGAQVVVIDTVGNWWGLRLDAKGKKEGGLQIPILGGTRGDVPLEPTAGAQVAGLVAESRSPMIVDVSTFTKGELRRFVTAFATTLLEKKRQHPGPLMVIWEECQDVVPQFVSSDVTHMVGAVEALIKKGRNYGVGTALLSQRPAAVNKDVLSQIETLFAFRANGPQDRKTIEGWVVDHAGDRSIASELPSLETGTCFCWSPQWLHFLGKITISKKHTFDASSTPEFGKASKAEALRPVDLKAFEVSMAEAIRTAKENDPKALRARADAAERKLAVLEKDHAALEHRLEATQAAAKPVATDVKIVTQLERLVEQMTTLSEKLAAPANEIVQALRRAQDAARLRPTVAPTHLVRHDAPKRVVVAHTPKNGAALGKCAREILAALANRHPTPLTRTQAATLSGYSQNSSGFANALSELNTGHYLSRPNGLFALSLRGIETTDLDDRVPGRPTDVLALWTSKLPGKEAAMLNALMATNGLERDALATLVDLSPTSSGFANYLSHLNSNGLITKRDGLIYAADIFR